LWSPAIDWEPTVAASPDGDRVVQATTRYGASCPGCADPSIVVRFSGDGGDTWGPDIFPAPSPGAQNDPVLHVGGDGTTWLAYMDGYAPGVAVVRSDDGGRSWSEPVHVARSTGWSDKPWLAVSPDGRLVHVAFNAGASWVVTSRDGGRTFGTPVRTGDDGRYWFHTGGAVAADGRTVFAVVDFSRDYRGAAGIGVLQSEDGGRSWRARRLDSSAEMPGCPTDPSCPRGFLGSSAAIAADGEGRLMLVYNAGDADRRPQALWYRTSADGRRWSPRRRLVTDGDRIHHVFPAVASAPGAGDFRVAWQDDGAPGGRWNTRYRRTRDGGRSWGPVRRLSRRASGAFYKDRHGYASPYGDYLGIAVDGSRRDHVIWGAGASYRGVGGTWFTRGDPGDGR
ncbi:MAG: sialidase family protein, partial [Acidobacteriota bacterium]